MLLETALAIALWLVALYKFPAALRGMRHPDRRVLRFWVFAVSLALCKTVQVDAVYTAIGDWTGIPNLAWLLTYVTMAMALYAIVLWALWKVPALRWPHVTLVVTLLALAAVFVLGVAVPPEYTDHKVPRSAFDLSFMEVLYVYYLVMSLAPIFSLVPIWRAERSLPASLRMVVCLGAMATSVLFITTAIATAPCSYLGLSTPALKATRSAGIALEGVASLAWILALLPGGVYVALARCVEYVEKLRVLVDLAGIEARISRIRHPGQSTRKAWWDWLTKPDFCIYRAIISTLDAKRSLSAFFRALDSGEQPTVCLDVLQSLVETYPGRALELEGSDALAEARKLLAALRAADDWDPYEKLVASYRAIGRELRT